MDEYLLQAAAEASPQHEQTPAIPPEEAIAHLSPEERDEFLVRLARGEPHLSLALNRRLRELAGTSSPSAGTPRRTWGELKAIR